MCPHGTTSTARAGRATIGRPQEALPIGNKRHPAHAISSYSPAPVLFYGGAVKNLQLQKAG
jgi:hypothetical protein